MIRRKQLLQLFSVLFTLFIITAGCKTSLYPKNFKDKSFNLKNTIPSDNEISGWSRDGEMIYCQDLVCLASLIDGAAPYYTDGGAVEMIFQDFKKLPENTLLTLEIYRTKNSSQAKGLYKGSSSISPLNIDNLGEEGRLDQGLIGSYRVETFKKNFFIRLVSMDKNETLKEGLLTFVKNITLKIP
ncbi:MAG: hypothetical protein A3C43_12425 [Candidatus Schekmanbacteria bacterium RIFCSPHIGHO2_02_FULL_38_11]|uniref:Uncharacterized protein n=1 Tax=Candidatus Schekmanbacteria bacterium RIFCSPLOWO2_12_FULL_38_15 TaxID=1817883 RepID=A0A1F7SI26_9BACT|nr:MAG: hypothetical protein A2043_04200 [Candidatus Schekmanbacteria bacterium GWA2_38_9]OGL50849.1 MAG: hypothetical protein A3H37_03295 [Candidatus Schekmanbacteria bacterium RIFCSPLOWO2_02_FULL_38_14]OGL53391.1 MAG: hypothetical protein A3G31_07770 [Candidatus Schekmanbacteria bacterium RIFCSPLOWO2_12_FULL_38_15]OGL55743.1 MAG: hypothetical protein A3C43_12425 [Candidatus Schekmanbacteria bacterium RIFCSPHIGHO2_02_FULL_38_11]